MVESLRSVGFRGIRFFTVPSLVGVGETRPGVNAWYAVALDPRQPDLQVIALGGGRPHLPPAPNAAAEGQVETSLLGLVRRGRPEVDPDIRDPLRLSGDAATLQRGQHVLLTRLAKRQSVERQRLLQPGPPLLVATQG